MVGRSLHVALLAVVSIVSAAGKQPVTAKGAVEAAEKLEPKATPIGKVIQLLKDLVVRIENEGKREAAAYDKYACFCKEQADEKLYQNDTSTKQVEELTAEIGELGTAITALDSDISALSTTITEKEHKIGNITEVRQGEHTAYLGKDADVVGAIDACARAIDTLKESKAALTGKAQMEALTQVKEAASKAAVLIALSMDQVSKLEALQPGQAYESKYHSNEIIETLENLRQTFIGRKNTQDKDEFEKNKLFEEEKLGLTNEVDFAKMEKDEKEKESAKKGARKAEATKVRDLEEKMRVEDMEYLKVLTSECQEKAKQWDQRSTTRGSELTALSNAIKALESGATENWKANRRLTDLQTKQVVAKAAKKVVPSFLQLRGAADGQKGKQKQKEKLLQLLEGAAKKLASPVLMMTALKARAADDHFVKVRSLIKDLIARLEAEALSELSHKEWCDGEARVAVGERDDAAIEKEAKEKQLEVDTLKKKKIQKDIASISEAIAANKKALLEATELRDEEKADNAEVVRQANIGKDQVEAAIEFLENFYNNAGPSTSVDPVLAQKGQKGQAHRIATSAPPGSGSTTYVPFKAKDSDREGNTVGDLAPDIFDDTYHGQQESSKGIIGLLQVILRDFERTGETTQDKEDEDETDFDTFKKANNRDTGVKDVTKGDLETDLSDAEDDLITLENERRDAVDSHGVAVDKLEKVREMCVEKDETYEERVEKRKQEIEALKQAHEILENWETQ